MDFARESRVTHPAALIVETMVERMHEIVPFLPSVDAIDLVSREDLADGRIHIVRTWQGSLDQAPRAMRPFLKKDLLRWTDDARWRPDDWCVDWTLSTRLAGLYRCGGTNYFEPHPDDPEGSTRIRITGSLTVYPGKLPGVPRFLAKRLAPTIESFVIGMITPNLLEVADGLQRYLDRRA